jgi:hypothetical protein
MGKKASPQRAELYRLREYGRKVRRMSRVTARANKYGVAPKVAGRVS